MMSLRVRVVLWAFVLSLMGAVFTGCPKDPCSSDSCGDAGQGGGTGGSGGSGGSGGGDGQFDAGPPPCKNDFDCQAGEICNTTNGKCEMGQGCSQDYECQSLDEQNRCYMFGKQCTCDTSASGGGVCRVRKGPCEECVDDHECGADPIIFGPPDGIGAGVCRAFDGDTSGKKYCRYQRVGGVCGCGTVDDGTGHCRPQTNSCTQVGCNADKDCPSDQVCSVSQADAGAASCGGLCVQRCRWDFVNHKAADPGCAPGQTCWVDAANLEPSSASFGAGRCKPACSNDSDCQKSAANPFGGSNLKCAAEKLEDGSDSPKRCRPNGECMDTEECTSILNLPSDQPYVGYCDRASMSCKSDCRPGLDPVSGSSFKDCRPPYACTADAGVNFCRLETCAEQGGATIACAQGEYCCGEDKNFDGDPDPCPPLSEQNAAGCYKAPQPPFCTQCSAGKSLKDNTDAAAQAAADAECAALSSPAWASCANGSKSPNCSTLKPICMYAGDKGNNMPGTNVCMVPSVNDVGSVSTRYGVVPKRKVACPSNYNVELIRPQPNPAQDVGYCQTDADCNLKPDGGVGTGGTCEVDMALPKQGGGFFKACRCDAKSGTSQCPNGTAPIGQVTSVCNDAAAGTRSFCIESVVCVPPRNSVYQTEYGCGL